MNTLCCRYSIANTLCDVFGHYLYSAPSCENTLYLRDVGLVVVDWSRQDVLLLDRATFPRDKPCGGGLMMRAVHELPFGVEPVVEQVVSARSASSYSTKSENIILNFLNCY